MNALRTFRRFHLAQKRTRRSARGMTLIEIMVVLVILGLIAGAIGYNVFQSLKEGQVRAAKLDLKALGNGVDLFHVETGQWPDSLQALVPKQLKEIRKDPWGSDYAFVRSGGTWTQRAWASAKTLSIAPNTAGSSNAIMPQMSRKRFARVRRHSA